VGPHKDSLGPAVFAPAPVLTAPAPAPESVPAACPPSRPLQAGGKWLGRASAATVPLLLQAQEAETAGRKLYCGMSNRPYTSGRGAQWPRGSGVRIHLRHRQGGGTERESRRMQELLLMTSGSLAYAEARQTGLPAQATRRLSRRQDRLGELFTRGKLQGPLHDTGKPLPRMVYTSFP